MNPFRFYLVVAGSVAGFTTPLVVKSAFHASFKSLYAEKACIIICTILGAIVASLFVDPNDKV